MYLKLFLAHSDYEMFIEQVTTEFNKFEAVVEKT